MLKLNRSDKELYATAHRIDTFFADIDPNGKVISVKVFFDAVHNTNLSGEKDHYGICERKIFQRRKQTLCKGKYLQRNIRKPANRSQSRQNNATRKLEKSHAQNKRIREVPLPKRCFGRRTMPFTNSLGCYLLRFTDDIPQIPNTYAVRTTYRRYIVYGKLPVRPDEIL